MMCCEQAVSALHLYLDNELAPADVLELEAHLLDCDGCRSRYEELSAVVDTVRGARPLYDPPPDLHGKLEALLAGADRTRRRAVRAGIAGALAAGVAILLFALPADTRGASFAAFAANAHLGYADGRLPLDIASAEPREVSSWLRRRLPFHLELPAYPWASGEPKAYTLAGARLMQYSGEDLAYLAYRMGGRPVSLLVSSHPGIEPSGSEVLRSGNLLFHFSVRRGLKVITWRDRDLVYALVSDVQVNNAESCVVCHGSAAERSRFENMSAPGRTGR